MGVLGPLWPHMPASLIVLNRFLIFATDLQIIYPHQFPYPHIPSQPASNTCLQRPYSWHKIRAYPPYKPNMPLFFKNFVDIYSFILFAIILIYYVRFFRTIYPATLQ